jgi:hypothetical protein
MAKRRCHTRRISTTTTLSEVELQRIVSLAEACRLSSLSEDTIKRRYRDKLIQVSPRRLGMRLGDALNLNQGEE